MKFAVDRGFWMPPAKKNSAMAMRCFWIFQFYERNQARIYGKNPHFSKRHNGKFVASLFKGALIW